MSHTINQITGYSVLVWSVTKLVSFVRPLCLYGV